MQISSHPFSQEQLMAYLDGELSTGEAAIAAAHLQHCRECRELAADLQSVSRYLSAWQIDEPSSALIECLQAASKTPLKKGEKLTWLSFLPKRQWPFSFAASGVMGVLITLAVFSWYSATSRHSYMTHAAYMPEYAEADKLASDRVSSGAVGGTRRFIAGVSMQDSAQRAAPAHPPAQAVTPSGPLIIRTVQLSLTTNDFSHIRESIDHILTSHAGYIARLGMNTPTGEARSLDASLSIPATQLDAALEELRHLGHVDSESQQGEEVTQRVVDVQARLENLRTTEARLTEILRQRTGKLADVLAVEEQIDSVRGQIESMEAEQKSLAKQIEFATVQLRVKEEYKKPLTLNNESLFTRLRNAAVEGFQTLENGVVGLLLFFLSYGPIMLITASVLFYPARRIWRRYSVS